MLSKQGKIIYNIVVPYLDKIAQDLKSSDFEVKSTTFSFSDDAELEIDIIIETKEEEMKYSFVEEEMKKVVILAT